MTEKRGILAVVSGFSGAGKGTLMKRLCNDYDNYALSISATTRSPRRNCLTGEEEQHGVDYFFISKDEFEAMIDRDDLVEYARYQGNYYGTPKAYVEEQIMAGRDVILEIEVQGANKIKTKFPGAVLIFVTPPSVTELEKRLRSRGTETEEEIRGRLRRATEEAEYIPGYDYLLVNDDLADSVRQLHCILEAEHSSTQRCMSDVHNITRELKELRKGE